MDEKIIGIMGGMGPEATIDLFSKIVEETHAQCDEDHLRIVIDNNPKMPSRQAAILGGGESPVSAMVATAENLKRAGADCIIIAANTAHYFYDEVSSQVDLPFFHIIDEAVKELTHLVPGIKRVGVLATTAAVNTKLYDKSCQKIGAEVIALDPDLQELIHQTIFDFKYQGLTKSLQEQALHCAKALIKKGAQAIIFGCTEIPLILQNQTFTVPAIDPNRVISKVLVAYAKNLIP